MRKLSPSVSDYSRGWSDGFEGKSNSGISKMYKLGYADGLNKRYEESQKTELVDKNDGVYADE